MAEIAVREGGYSYHKIRDDAHKFDPVTTYCGITLGSRGRWFDSRWHILESIPNWLPLCGRCERTMLHQRDKAIKGVKGGMVEKARDNARARQERLDREEEAQDGSG